MPHNTGNKIEGIEIFSTGTWNGKPFNIADLDAMVDAFEKTSNGFRPFLKLGHSKEQDLLKNSGLPAAGWADSIYRKGDKLLADFANIPRKVFELIKKGAYRKVSVELFNNIKIKDQTFARLIGSIALLGAENPGVMNLDDILEMYGIKGLEPIKCFSDETDDSNIEVYSFENKEQGDIEMPKSELEIQLETKLAAAEKKNETLQGDVDKYTKDVDTLKTSNDALTKDAEAKEKANADLLLEKKDAEVKAFTTGLISEKLCTPSMVPLITEILAPEKEEYSLKSGDKELKSKEEILKEALSLFKSASKVNFDESSLADTNNKGKSSGDKLEARIEEYAKENEVPYVEAYKAVMASERQDEEEEIEDEQ